MEPVVLQKEALGFICNRLQMAPYREVANLAARPAETGSTPESLASYRDHMLIELLKLHGKLQRGRLPAAGRGRSRPCLTWACDA